MVQTNPRNDHGSSKETLRREALSSRDRIESSPDDVAAATSVFMRNIHAQSGDVVAFYWPKGREFDPRGIVDSLRSQGISCALPVMQDGVRELKFALREKDDALAAGPFGVMQPVVDEDTKYVDPDILIVPLLAFDKRGYRLGYGSGYYDATLKSLRARKKILAVGLGYAQQAVLFSLPSEPHDERLDWVVTPQQAFHFA